MKYTHLATISLISILISATCVITLHILVPEYNPLTRAMSNYVNSTYSWMMVVAFLGFASSQFALVIAFRRTDLSKWQRIGIVCLMASGTSILIAGIFPTDRTLDDQFITTIGAIHAIAGYLLSPFSVGAMLCLSGKIDSIGSYRTASTLAIMTTIAFIVLMGVNTLGLKIGGIGQRIFIALVCTWLVLASLRLAKFTES